MSVPSATVPRAGRAPLRLRVATVAGSALLGAATVPGFAPFYLWPLPILTLAALAWLIGRAPTPLRAAGGQVFHPKVPDPGAALREHGQGVEGHARVGALLGSQERRI